MAYIVTGHKGVAHITSDDVSAFQQCIAGTGDYVLVGSTADFSATVQSNNIIELSKAELLIQGVHCRIEDGDVVSVEPNRPEISRNDYIIGRYTNNAGVENFEICMKTGSKDSFPQLEQSDIRNGGLVREVALFSVVLSGAQVSSIRRVIPPLYSIYQVKEDLRNLTTRVANINGQVERQASDLVRTNNDVQNLSQQLTSVRTNFQSQLDTIPRIKCGNVIVSNPVYEVGMKRWIKSTWVSFNLNHLQSFVCGAIGEEKWDDIAIVNCGAINNVGKDGETNAYRALIRVSTKNDRPVTVNWIAIGD